MQCLAAGILFLALLAAAPVKAQSPAPTASIDGYWELTAEFPDYDLNSVVRFKTATDTRTVEGIVLGPTSGRDSSFIWKISNNQLSSKVAGPLGEMQVNLTLSGSNLSGTWATAELQGNVRGTRMTSRKPEPIYYPKVLNFVCQSIRNNFYDPRFNGVDIEPLKAKYAARLPSLKDDADFVKLIKEMLSEFKASHTDFYLAPKTLPLKDKTPPISWRKLSSQTQYLRIRHFDPLSLQDQQNYDRLLEKSLEEIGDSPSLVLDMRGNRGGNLSIVFRVLGYFLQPGQDVCYVFAKAGAGKISALSNAAGNDEAGLPVIENTTPSITGEITHNGAAVIRLNAEQKKWYQGKIVILVDEHCFSGCESFSAILQEKGRAILIGKRTGGKALGSYTDTIVKNMVIMKKDTGWRLEIPIIDFRTIKGKRIEGNGVKPDIEMTARGETILAEALRYLEQASARQR